MSNLVENKISSLIKALFVMAPRKGGLYQSRTGHNRQGFFYAQKQLFFHIRTYPGAITRAYPACERTQIREKTANYLLLHSTSGTTGVFGTQESLRQRLSADRRKKAFLFF
jgi:hypothetical protein